MNAKRYFLKGQLLLLVFFGFLGTPIFRLFACPRVFRRESGRRGSLGNLDVIFAVFLLEPLYSARRIDIFLLAGIERMAHRAYLGVDFFGGTAGLEGIATAAVNHDLIVFWMYLFFHNYSAPEAYKAILTKFADSSIKIFVVLRFYTTE